MSFDAGLFERCRAIPTATWSDALDELGVVGVLDGIVWRSGARRIAGPALAVAEETWPVGTVAFEAFDVGAILSAASAGTVLVVAMSPPVVVSTFGGLAARAAVARGVAGAIIDGGCRDVEEIRERGFFVASRDVTPRSGKRRIRIAVRRAVTCGGVRVATGDGIVADQTGIVAIPAARFVEALAVAEQLQGRDARFASELDAGQEFASVASRLRHV